MATSSNLVQATPVLEGDLKKSFRLADHFGWYLLDGRALAALPAAAQAAAGALGIAALPNIGKRVTRHAGAVLSIGGAAHNADAIAQANIPAYDMTATSDASPNTHTHGVNNGTNVWTSPGGTNFRAVGTNNGSPPRTASIAVGGAHAHAFTGTPSGRLGSPVDLEINALSCNTFMYLGL